MSSTQISPVYPVPSGWTLRTVDQIKAPVRSSCVAGPFGSSIASRYFVPEGVPVIRGSNLRDDLTRFVADEFVYVTEQQAREDFGPQTVVAGDLVFTCWGTVGQLGIIPVDGPFASYIISNKQLKLRLNTEVAAPLFCFYYFGSPRYVEYLRNRGIGGAVPGINLGILKSLPIALPTLERQNRIAGILDAYDTLITNNRRRIALLESAARLLYEEWFVRLRFPGHERVAVVDGVPVGWIKRTGVETFDVLSGGTPKTSVDSFWSGDIPFYTPKDAAESVWAIDTERAISASGLATCNSKLYPRGTVFISARGTVGKLNIAQRPMAMSQSCYALVGCHGLPQTFVYLSISAAVEVLRAQASGAVFDAIVVDTFKRFDVLAPTFGILAEFDRIVGQMFAQIENLTLQSRSLTAARDLLLPRLMSGELQP